jgi:hypothetical protein
MSPELLDEKSAIVARGKCCRQTLARTHDPSFESSVLRRIEDDYLLALVQGHLDIFALRRRQIINFVKDDGFVVSAIGLLANAQRKEHIKIVHSRISSRGQERAT